MRYLTPFRIAAALLVIFCAFHTAGGMLSHASFGPESDAVVRAMKSVRVDFNGSIGTWYGFWLGLGLIVSVFLLFSAIAAWQLDRIDPATWPAVSPLAWVFAASHAATAALTWRYFFAGAGITATLVTLFLVLGAWRKQRAAALAAGTPGPGTRAGAREYARP